MAILRNIPELGAVQCAERIRRKVESAVIDYEGQRIPITVSLGVATLVNGNYTAWEQLVEAADTQLYVAKRAGRNRVASSLDGT